MYIETDSKLIDFAQIYYKSDGCIILYIRFTTWLDIIAGWCKPHGWMLRDGTGVHFSICECEFIDDFIWLEQLTDNNHEVWITLLRRETMQCINTKIMRKHRR